MLHVQKYVNTMLPLILSNVNTSRKLILFTDEYH